MKRFLLLAIAALAFVGCNNASSVEFEEGAKPAKNEIWYISTDGEIVTPSRSNVFGATIVSNTYEDGMGVITFDGAVTTIGDGAFIDCNSLTSITIPDSVTTIGELAFYSCDSLTSVTIGDSVTTIGGSAFAGCESLTSITIPDSVTTIGVGAFSDCDSLKEFKGKYVSDDGRCLIIDGTLNSFAPAGLTEYTIPDSVTTIGDEAFLGCDSLTSVTIPDSVTTLGGGAFSDCDSLKEFKGKYATDNGRCLIKDNTIIAYAEASGTEYTIPDSVTAIGECAFAKCSSLTSVTIPDSVTTIGDSAFSGCDSLTSVNIGDSVTTIGEWAFLLCESLTSVTIPDSVTTIGEEAFIWCDSLTSVTIGDSVTTIGDNAFYDCESLTSVTIGDSVTTIGDWAFSGCSSLTSVTIPDSVTTIGVGAFSDCDSLKEFKGKYASDDGRCLIVDNTIIAYAYASGTEYTIPNSVTTIGEWTFGYCYGLTSITIPDSVTTIGGRAFSDCTSLTSVTIPDSVTTIGDNAFSDCAGLKEVYCKPTTPPTMGSSVFGDTPLEAIYVPTASVDAYKAADVWCDYADDIVGYDF